METLFTFLERMAETPSGTLVLLIILIGTMGLFFTIYYLIRAFRQNTKEQAAGARTNAVLNANLTRTVDRLVDQGAKHVEAMARVGDAMEMLTRQNQKLTELYGQLPDAIQGVQSTIVEEHSVTRATIVPVGEAVHSLRSLLEQLIEAVRKLDNADIKEELASLTQQAVGMWAMLESIQQNIDAIKPEPQATA